MTGTIEYEYEYEVLQLTATFEIDYDAAPGRPGRKYDRFGDPGSPPDAPEMEITGVRFISGTPADETARAPGIAHIDGAGHDDVVALCWEDVNLQMEAEKWD